MVQHTSAGRVHQNVQCFDFSWGLGGTLMRSIFVYMFIDLWRRGTVIMLSVSKFTNLND